MQRTGGAISRARKWISVGTSFLLTIGGLTVVALAAPATATAAAAAPPVTESSVSADQLPTVQIDGVVWSQAVANNMVYAGGTFDNARPAGSAPGVNLVERKNLLAYDITTGELNTSFVPKLNGSALVVTVSPDGRTLYAGGNFTFANANERNHIVAYDLATGQVKQSFAPSIDGNVKAIYATNSTVYVGGSFTTANGVARGNLAAFGAADGALLNWAPTSDASVSAIQLTPDGSKLIVGGFFTAFNGVAAKGLEALDPATGAILPWAATAVVRNGGTDSSITSLSTDGTSIYGTGYVFNSAQGNLEGAFSADPTTGNVNWIDDCHGDTYSSYALGGALYTVGHAHMCDNIGGFPETIPRTWWRAQAFTTQATGTIHRNSQGNYYNWAGYSSPSPLSWYPALDQGTASGQGQAAWSVTGNGQYVVLGGEFPAVNSTKQQGLVRFAVRSAAPKKIGPGPNPLQKPTLTSSAPGTIRLGWQTTWDRDDATLTYKVYRNGILTTPIYTVNADSKFWDKPFLTFTDKNLTPGRVYSYRVFAYDQYGNSTASGSTTLAAGTASTTNAHTDRVIADGATQFWRLNEPTGTAAFDSAGGYDTVVGSAVTRGAVAPIAGDTASTFNGTSTSTIATQYNMYGPKVFSAQAWFRTTTATGGEILGFGTSTTGLSTTNDRAVFMTNSGKLAFDIYPGAHKAVISTNAYNDGQWHQVTATFDGTTMSLLVDGVFLSSRNDAVFPWYQAGSWRIGGDKLTSMTGAPTSNYFTGDIANVAIYPTALTRDQVAAQYVAAGRTTAIPAAPTDIYGAAVYADNPDIYWRLNDANGSATAADSSRTLSTGDYRPATSATQVAGAIAGTTDAAGSFNGTSTGVASRTLVQGPNTFTAEAWVKTTSKLGGKVVGFSGNQSTTGGNYDRMIYLQSDGKAVFGINPATRVTLVSPTALNDGAWHHVVGTLGAAGTSFYVDGTLVGSAAATAAQSYTGYWRAGSGTIWNSTTTYLAGTIDEVAVYPIALPAERVAAHFFAGRSGAANVAPTAAFTTSVTNRTVGFDGSTSTDSDGSIASYSWNYGDGTTGTGATGSHTYGANGTYNATLTVTDNGGLTNAVTHPVTVNLPNLPPTARFTSSAVDLAVAFDGSTSSDPDQSIAGYAWDFGDGTSQPKSGVPTANHTFTATGTYPVRLTVTDSEGGTAAFTSNVSVQAANVAPVAAFAAAVTALTVSVDATASTDSDGTIAAYAWDFGDGTTGTGKTASHSYTAAATYQITLTVTDDRTGTNSVSKSVVTSAPAAANHATDAFTRAVVNGFGTADLGGAWTLSGATTNYATSGTAAKMTLGTAGLTTQALLNSVRALDTDITADVSIDKIANGGGVYASLVGRRLNSNDYRAKVRVLSNGTLSMALTRVTGSTETALVSQSIPGVLPVNGILRVRFQIVGTVASTGSTTLNAKAWLSGTAEPAAWQVTTTDTTAALQVAGGVGLAAYLSGSSTNVPVGVTWDNLAAGTPKP